WLQVTDAFQDFELLPVIGFGLAGEAPKEVPLDLNAVVAAPLEQAHVLKHGAALAHQLEHVAAQTLDARLDAAHSTQVQRAELLAGQVGLHFVEQLEADLSLVEAVEKTVEILQVQDVIDGVKEADAMLACQFRELRQYALRALGTVAHAQPVQA